MVYEPLYHALGRVCSKLKQAENRLHLQIKSGRILNILNKIIYSTRVCWIWDDYSHLCATNTPR